MLKELQSKKCHMNRILAILRQINEPHQKWWRIVITIITIIRGGGIEKTNEVVNKGRESQEKNENPRNRVLVTLQARNFPLLQNTWQDMKSPPRLKLLWQGGGFFYHGVKHTENKAGRSPTSSAKISNIWSVTSNLPSSGILCTISTTLIFHLLLYRHGQ